MPSSSFFSGTNPTPTEYENAVDLVAQATAQATAALASQTAAATSAQSAQGYSVSAGTSADTATTQAASAASSATSASNSATNASSSASSASSSATSASTSASNAATSATNASNSATSAAGSASSASTYATNAASSATAAANSASDAAATLANALVKTNNLADLSNAGTARTNLGVAIGSNVQAWDADLDAIAAISSTSGLLKKTAANTWTLDTTSYHSGTLGLSEGGTGATDAAGARSNLGLGTAATAAATSFLQVANNLSDLTSASSARTALGLGSAALLASSAVLQSANNLSDLGNVVTARSSLGLGSLATLSSINNSNWSGTQLSVANGGTGLTSIPAASIPYGNGTGALYTSSTFVYTGVNLGVGIASPGATIDAAGAIRTVSNQSAGGFLMQYSGLSSASRTWRLSNDVTAYGDFAIQQSTTQTGATYANMFYMDASGNVGIGTSSPISYANYSTVTVSGTNGGVLHLKNTANTAVLETAATATAGYFKTTSAIDLYFGTANTERIRITSGGLVGIGTSSPYCTLNVSASDANRIILVSGTTYGLRLGTDAIGGIIEGVDKTGTTSFAPIFVGGSLVNLTINGVTKATLDASGNLGLGVTPSAWGSNFKSFEFGNAGYGFTTAVSSGYVYTVQNVFNNGTNWVYKSNGSASRSYAKPDGFVWDLAASGTAGSAISFTQAMTLDASGNLGVGATSITAFGAGYRTLQLQGSSGSGIRLQGGASDYGYFYADSGSFTIMNPANLPIVIGTNNTERVRILSGGTILVSNSTAPGSNPSGGGYLYVESGALKYRGSSGTVTTIANA